MRRSLLPLLLIVLGLAIAVGAFMVPLRAAKPQPASATTTPATQTARSLDDVLKDLDANSSELDKVIPGPAALLNPKVRQQSGAKAIPLLRKTVSLLEEVARVDARFKSRVQAQRSQYMALLVALGDQPSLKTLEAEAQSKDPSEALEAKTTLALGQWWQHNADPAAQRKVLDTVRDLAKAYPNEEEPLIQVLMAMSQMGPANKANARAAEDIIINDLKGQTAKALGEELREYHRLHDLYDNKPVTLAAKTLEGKPFTTADWKGKVILVDFWATWCPPCVAEVPHLKALFDKYHKDGLEIVGVSSDRDTEDLTTFLKETKDITWPQLFDPDHPGTHALAKQFGVHMYPTMFLIDRNGVLRNMDVREDIDTEIPALLAEKPGATQPATAPVASEGRK